MMTNRQLIWTKLIARAESDAQQNNDQSKQYKFQPHLCDRSAHGSVSAARKKFNTNSGSAH